MEPKQRLFIYDRKEFGVLILLGVMVALFAFTLGVHLGKKTVAKPVASQATEHRPAETTADQVPNTQELSEQSKGAPQAADESMNQALHDEVARTGIRMDSPKPMKLPENTRAANGGATTFENTPKPSPAPTASPRLTGHGATAPVHGAEPRHEQAPMESESRTSHESSAAAHRPAPSGKYTLQVGAFRTLEEASDHVKSLESQGIKPYLREVNLRGKGKWFRVYLGGYATREDAEAAGTRYKARNIIDTFIVANRVE